MNTVPIIVSERLELHPLTTDFLPAILHDDLEAAPGNLDTGVPEELPDLSHSLAAHRLRQLENDPKLQAWLLRAMVLRESGTMIGQIGFHDTPGA